MNALPLRSWFFMESPSDLHGIGHTARVMVWAAVLTRGTPWFEPAFGPLLCPICDVRMMAQILTTAFELAIGYARWTTGEDRPGSERTVTRIGESRVVHRANPVSVRRGPVPSIFEITAGKWLPTSRS